MFFKLAIRNLRREKLYAVLNIAGFALGIASCLMLGVYLWGELSYDRHHVNHERIYRVVQHITFDGQESGFAQTAAVLGPMLAEDRPDVVERDVGFYRPGWNRQGSLLRREGCVD